MKNASGRIDQLLEVLVTRAEAAIGNTPTNVWATPPGLREELEWLIRMSNLNNARQEKVGKTPGPQSKVADDVTNEELVATLKAGRDPDLFPRRGPRNGKRENAGLPLPPDVVTCAVHEGVVCVRAAGPHGTVVVCPDCAKTDYPQEMVSLKALK